MTLALVVLLLSLMVFQMFQKMQLIMFDSISLNMPLESVEKVFGKPNEIVEETETGYHNPWHAKDPYLYKTGRLFYDYENFKWKGYSGRVTFTFSKSHRLQGASVYFPVASKAQQKELVDNLSQIVKTELEALADYKSLTVEMVGIDHDTYQYKVKLQGKTGELRVEVSPTELGYHEKPEDKKYGVSISQSRSYS